MKASQLYSIICISALAASFPLRAANFVVSDLGDAGAGTLRQAILDANVAPGDSTITFSVTGTITLATNLPGITVPVAISGPGTNFLTINGAGKYSAFWFNGVNSNSIADVAIANTRTLLEWFGGSGGYTNASGIHSLGPLTLRRCILTNCASLNSWGGAIYSGGNLDAEACLIINCRPPAMSAYKSAGGAIHNLGQSRLKDCHITGCVTADLQGGGIYNNNSGSMFLTNVRIEGCWAEDGGGIYNGGTMVINDSVVENCGAMYWGGGIWGWGPLAMTNTTIRYNRSSDVAGGMVAGLNTVLSGCTISSNRSFRTGCGIQVTGNLKAYNCTISQNVGSLTAQPPQGNAIADNGVGSAIGKVELNHCTVVSNLVPVEVSSKGTFTVANSIVGTSTGAINSQGQNLFTSTNGVTITNNLSGNFYNVSPNLGPLQNNGGPTWTHALLPGSPAIDSGDAGGLTTDQRGALRPALADIGAYEVVTVTPPNLFIAQADPTHVILSWPSAAAPLVLQERSSLSLATWLDVNIPPLNDGVTTSVTVPSLTDGKSYRLRNP